MDILTVKNNGQNSKRKSIPESLRWAIWEVYSKNCLYCGQPILSPKELEIDHIIPVEIPSKQLKDICNCLGINKDFEFNEPINLVPAHRRCNASKSNYVPSKQHLIGLRIIAEKKLDKILSLQKSFEQKTKNIKDYSNNIIALERQIASNFISPEDIYDSLTKDSNPFPETERLDTSPIQLSKPNVLLHCFLPEFPKLQGSIMISFRSLKIRGCTLSFGHQEIAKLLFEGIYSPIELNLRPFLQTNHLNQKECVLSLNNARFAITVDEAKQLCELIDKIASRYVNAFKEIEDILKTSKFEPSIEGGVRILKIDRSLLNKTIEFARKHDGFDGNSKWDVFDPNEYYLKIFTNQPNLKRKDYRAFIYPEIASKDDLGRSLRYPDTEVWLRWDPSILLYSEENPKEKVESNKTWNAEFTCNWLETVLLPEIIRKEVDDDYNLLAKFIAKGRTYQQLVLGRPYTETYIDFDKISNQKELTNAVLGLQTFYLINQNSYVSPKVVRGIYEAFLIALENFDIPNNTIGYVAEKTCGKYKLEEIIEFVKKKFKDTNVVLGADGAHIEYVLRPIYAILEESVPYNKDALHQITEKLFPIWREYCFLKDLIRLKEF